jgi:hypothetical protein
VLVMLHTLVCFVIVLYQFNEFFVQATLYKVALKNKTQFSKVCHFFYNAFSETLQVVPPGGIA